MNITPLHISKLFELLGDDRGPVVDRMVYPIDVRYNETGVMICGWGFPHEKPRLMFARLLELFSFKEEYCEHNNSYIAVGTSYSKDLKIGKHCTIGGPGFGYEKDGERYFHVPHMGNVIMGDRVEIRSGVRIDRDITGSTRIGNGVKIDNNVTIAHGCTIGDNTIICASADICGHVTIGNNCYIGAGSRIKQRVTIGDNSMIGLGAVVTKDVPPGEVWKGVPARFHAQRK